MITASDGTAFTGAVTVYVTGDAGTQAIGSVGSGACTHEGNGYHTYAPAQAETNYDLVAFTFIGTGAIPTTVQIYTHYPQTGDSYARLGAPAGASVSADIAAIEAQTDDIGAAGAGLTAVPWNAAWDAEVQSEAADAITAAGLLNAADTRTAVGLASANLDTQLATIAGYIDTEITTILANLATVDGVADAIKAKTDNLPASPAAVGSAMTLTSAYDFAKGTSAMAESYAANGAAPTPTEALMAIHQMLMQFVIAGTSLTVKKLDNTTTAFVVTLDSATEPTSAVRT